MRVLCEPVAQGRGDADFEENLTRYGARTNKCGVSIVRCVAPKADAPSEERGKKVRGVTIKQENEKKKKEKSF